ncbi:tyrosinase [Trametes maxima]|nr:tyrosinase [Trametes maxima]
MTQSACRIVTTGPSLGGQTPVAIAPNRIEINDFIQNEKMFSLYVQALQAMMDTPQDDDRSFFQIAGIHGLPYVPWNYAGEAAPGKPTGYCVHGSVLFPTWHRPYVALFEQILQEHAVRIANTYVSDTDIWCKVAADLRQPYWDWAKSVVPPPELTIMERVIIITPSGKHKAVANPLLRYRFCPVDSSFADPFTEWPTTIRHPTCEGSHGQVDIDAFLAMLEANQADITSKTYGLLTRTHTWDAFSCHSPGNAPCISNSLEAIHDAVHDCVGGGGHMGDPAYAAFDPIFMFHHCQVDRLLSLWEALNPGVWVSEDTAGDGTFTIPSKAIVDENTALAPFRSSQCSFWTSKKVAGVTPTQLGYSYPEFNDIDLSDRPTVARHIAGVVNGLYAPEHLRRHLLSGRDTKTRRSDSEKNTPSLSSQTDFNILETPDRTLPPSQHRVNGDSLTTNSHAVVPPSTPLWQWTARIRIKKHEVGGAFAVLLFLGPVPDDPKGWHTAPSYVGAHHAFVNSATAQCANCRGRADAATEGFVHLDEAIAKRVGLSSHEPEAVKGYLRQALSWRVRKADGTAVPLEGLGSLEVLVFAQPLSLPKQGEISLATGPPQLFDDITEERPGGKRLKMYE